MRRSADTTGVGLVVIAAVGFGIAGPLSRVAGDVGFNAVTYAFWRSLGSVVALVTMLAIGIALARAPYAPLRSIGRTEWKQLLATGVCVAGTSLGIFLAIELTTIALALIVFYTYPVIVAVLAARLYGEALGARRLAAILLASAGIVLVLAPGAIDEGGVNVLGVAFALLAAISQVGYALLSSSGFSSVPSLQAATIQRASALLIFLVLVVPVILILGDGQRLMGPLEGLEAWLIIVVAGLFTAALPMAMLVAGYRRIGPTRGAVLMLIEPLAGVLIAALWLAEQPAPVQLLGGLLVLLGAGLAQLAPTPSRPSETTGLAEG